MASEATDSSRSSVEHPAAFRQAPAATTLIPLPAEFGERWAASRVKESQRFWLAAVAALLLHALPVLIATGGWGGGIADRTSFGDPAGSKDGVNVEIIDAAEYDRRFVSFTPGRSEADSEPKQSSPEQPPVSLQAMSEPEPNLRPEPSPSPKTSRLSDADIASILESSRLDAESVAGATSRASIASQGQASEFVRATLRRLKQNMPRSNGIKGTVVIGIVLSERGRLQWVGVIKSSGRRELDSLIVERIRVTPFEETRASVPLQERKFQITYEYN